jgi:hypothetical protein
MSLSGNTPITSYWPEVRVGDKVIDSKNNNAFRMVLTKNDTAQTMTVVPYEAGFNTSDAINPRSAGEFLQAEGRYGSGRRKTRGSKQRKHKRKTHRR